MRLCTSLLTIFLNITFLASGQTFDSGKIPVNIDSMKYGENFVDNTTEYKEGFVGPFSDVGILDTFIGTEITLKMRCYKICYETNCVEPPDLPVNGCTWQQDWCDNGDYYLIWFTFDDKTGTLYTYSDDRCQIPRSFYNIGCGKCNVPETGNYCHMYYYDCPKFTTGQFVGIVAGCFVGLTLILCCSCVILKKYTITCVWGNDEEKQQLLVNPAQ